MDIVICATQRCGSTLFIEDMRNAGVFGTPEEWFIPWDENRNGVDWQDELSKVYGRCTGANGIRSVKIMASQLSAVDKCISTFAPHSDEGMFSSFANKFKDAVWVWVTRQDIVLQGISRLMAEQTRVYHATGSVKDTHFAGNLKRGYDTKYNELAEYDYDKILAKSCSIVLENLAWRRFFETHNITPLCFEYENVIVDKEISHLDSIAHALNLSDSFEKEPRKMVKLANALNDQWSDRFFAESAVRKFSISKI